MLKVMNRFIVIGISDHPHPFFSPEVLEIIKGGRVFSGGKRHHEIVAPLLPGDARWIDITAPLDAVFENYQVADSDSIVVFASGDPLFYGFANTIRRKMPQADIVVYPSFNSLQLLAHRLLIPYHDMRIVSLTGRPWPEFDKALIERAGKIGVLTDREHTPSAIAQHMLDYGYTCYTMSVGEHLGNPSLERVTTCSLEDASHQDFCNPNCIILKRKGQSVPVASPANDPTYDARPFGIPDADFSLLNGREKMITKMPIRLLTLQALELSRRNTFWDIGFCTGSVSIEARLLFPHLHICSFEIRPECESIIHENMRRFGAPGIDVYMGDFLERDITTLPCPDAVFIGGHGGHLKEIVAKVLSVMDSGGVIVFNSVSSPHVPVNSRKLWDETCTELNLQQDPPLCIRINDYNPIEILKAHYHG